MQVKIRLKLPVLIQKFTFNPNRPTQIDNNFFIETTNQKSNSLVRNISLSSTTSQISIPQTTSKLKIYYHNKYEKQLRRSVTFGSIAS